MPELSGRSMWEKRLRREFNDVGKRYLKRVIEYMGDPPNPDNIPASLWRALGNDLRARFEPILQAIYLESAQQLKAATDITIDWAMPNTAAAEWAKSYTFDLVRQINRTTEQGLQGIFERFFTERGMTVGDLRKLIQPEVKDLIVTMRDGSTRLLTSAARAKLIATTEVTRAAVEGERPMLDQIAEAGIEMVAIWETQRDNKVCSICEPRQGHERGDGWEDDPPAHPGCYCNLRYEPRAMTVARG